MRERVQNDYVLPIFFACPLLRSILSKIGERLMLATLLTTSKDAFEDALLGLGHRLRVLHLQSGFKSTQVCSLPDLRSWICTPHLLAEEDNGDVQAARIASLMEQ